MNHFAIIVLVIVSAIMLTALTAVVAVRSGWTPTMYGERDPFTPSQEQTQYMRQVHKDNLRDLEAAGSEGDWSGSRSAGTRQSGAWSRQSDNWGSAAGGVKRPEMSYRPAGERTLEEEEEEDRMWSVEEEEVLSLSDGRGIP